MVNRLSLVYLYIFFPKAFAWNMIAKRGRARYTMPPIPRYKERNPSADTIL